MTADLLNSTNWSAKALAGEWKALSGGQIDVIEPATGQALAFSRPADGRPAAPRDGLAPVPAPLR